MKKIRLGIIGLGNMGTAHGKNVYEGKCPDMELVAIADMKESRRKWAEENFQNVQCFEKAEDMINSGLIEACIISVPHYEHTKYAIECMKNSVHVMVEKPAGVYTLQVREMNEEAKKHPEVVFGMMFNQRTNHIYRKMYDLVHSGKYGQIRRTNWMITNWYRCQAYYDSGEWRATWSGEGGGVLLNQCPHQLDLWQWICGMPVSVEAHLHYGKWHNIEVEDDVTVYVEYENGATGIFVTSTGDACGTNRFEIQMDGAKLVAENDELTVTEFEMLEQDFSAMNKTSFGSLNTKVVEVETDGMNEQHLGVLNAWSGAILHGTKLVANGEDGINGLMISNAIHLSSFLGEKVKIPFDEKLFYDELMKRVKTSKRKEHVFEMVADTSESYAGTH